MALSLSVHPTSPLLQRGPRIIVGMLTSNLARERNTRARREIPAAGLGGAGKTAQRASTGVQG